ncbi:hypothetical protein [Desmospora profundinema]|uniref:FAD-dependent urate hydroxylase HpyO FAD/NAD(P)-binding domain-containing protein n=1 Tax=Desmospora profundinema TaxID=1571184 RepID=A0ABU1ILN8_9BACL|nr:hypothetical protein [Desmospora profundinema]MDR6225694.1 hypothetical protein [Desmospora profundinema]
MKYLTKVNQWIENPYPLEQKLAVIQPEKTVAVAGLGLAAVDVLAELTLGRGGTLESDPDTGEPVYHASGWEPKIVFFSRSGLPYLSRPLLNEKIPYHPFLFTEDRITKLRHRHGTSQLHLEFDVLPLIWKEMKIRYYVTCIRHDLGWEEAIRLEERIGEQADSGDLDSCIESLRDRYGVFDPEKELQFSFEEGLYSREEYQDQILFYLQRDLMEAKKGVAHSPLKAAFEVLRDLRQVIRHTVDFRGLDPASHQIFKEKVIPLINRVVIGPPIERTELLLACIKAGIVQIPFGPNPRIRQSEENHSMEVVSTQLSTPYKEKVDYLCKAFVPEERVEENQSRLITNLYKQGRLKSFYNQDVQIGGVDLNGDLQPINAIGETERNFWVLGPLSEGVKYYNHYILSPGEVSPAVVDAKWCVHQFFERFSPK